MVLMSMTSMCYAYIRLDHLNWHLMQLKKCYNHQGISKYNDHIIKLYSNIKVHCFGSYYIDILYIFCKYSNSFIDNKSMVGE